jgi:hypothetical protein
VNACREFGFNASFLAIAPWQLGECDEARRPYDRAVARMEKHRSGDEELNRSRAEAEELLRVRPRDPSDQ